MSHSDDAMRLSAGTQLNSAARDQALDQFSASSGAMGSRQAKPRLSSSSRRSSLPPASAALI